MMSRFLTILFQSIRSKMISFPVTDSTLSAMHLSLFLQKKYGFNNNTSCKLFRTGINHTYMISENENKYVFRVYSYNWRTETEIMEELRLLILLKENNIGVSYPIPDKGGKYIHTIQAPEGLRYAVLFSFAEGEKVRNLTVEACSGIGSLMANIHKITINQEVKRIQYNAHTLTQLPYQYATSYFSESMEEMQFVKKASDELTLLFAEVDPGKLRYGTVHLDLWYDNMSIKDESAITVFDFDFCGNGWLLLDIAYFTMQLFNTEPDVKLFKLRLDSFFKGYQDVTPIHDDEKKLLPYAGLAIWIFYLGVQSQRFDNWSNIFLSKNYLKHFIGIIKNWMNYNKIEIKGANELYV